MMFRTPGAQRQLASSLAYSFLTGEKVHLERYGKAYRSKNCSGDGNKGVSDGPPGASGRAQEGDISLKGVWKDK